MSGPADRSGPHDEPDWGDLDAWAADEPADPADDHHDGTASRSDAPWAGIDDDPRVQAGIEHVQRAAHEMIAASRALLDVAEELVDAPGGVTRLFGVLGELGEVAGRLARPGGRPVRSDDGPDPDPPVQRIPVS